VLIKQRDLERVKGGRRKRGRGFAWKKRGFPSIVVGVFKKVFRILKFKGLLNVMMFGLVWHSINDDV